MRIYLVIVKKFDLHFSIILLIVVIGLCDNFILNAQYQQNLEAKGDGILMHALEFSIPVSPAFDLLGVNPCLVPKPSLVRNFKVDWSFKSYGLSPNLALQTQPINELYFNTPKKLKEYHKKSRFVKFISTLDLSIGTVEGNNNLETKQVKLTDSEGNDSTIFLESNWKIRSFAYAMKINLYREQDPLNEKKLFSRILKEYDEHKVDLKNQLREQQSLIKQEKDFEKKLVLREEVRTLEVELNSLDNVYLERMRNVADLYRAEKWNSSYVDIAFGHLLDYDSRDSSLFKFKDLRIVNTKWALWLNASKGIGKNILTSGILRFSSSVNELVNEHIVSLDVGANLRYGNHRTNFFIEGFVPFYFQEQEFIDNFNISIGGDWRFSRNVIINYGMRTLFNSAYKLENIIPVVSISCMMR